jgi:hypothetical protein
MDQKLYMKNYYEKNKERLKQKRKEYYHAHREEAIDKSKAYVLANPEKVRQRKKKYYEEHEDEIKAKSKERYEAKKDYIKEQSKAYNKSKGAIKKKLRRHKEEDNERKREFNLTEQYIIELLGQQENKCKRCQCDIKTSWTDKYDPQQFSINRINNSVGHIVNNVELTCLQCNRFYRE